MFITTIAVAISVAAPSAPVQQVTVRTAGAEYVQTTEADGTRVLNGRYTPGGKPFRLRVATDGTVRGWDGNRFVKFHVSELGNTAD